MAGPRVADKGHGLQIWRWWSFSFGVEQGDNNSSLLKRTDCHLLRNATQDLRIGRVLWNDLGNEKWINEKILLEWILENYK
jgi:hypothetical protein